MIKKPYKRRGKSYPHMSLLIVIAVSLAFALGLLLGILLANSYNLNYSAKNENAASTSINTTNSSVAMSDPMPESISEPTIEPTIEQTVDSMKESTIESTPKPTIESTMESIVDSTSESVSTQALLLPVDMPEVQEIINSMTLYEKICQMFIVIPDTITYVSGTTVAGSIVENAIKKYPVGGLILMSQNITSETQIMEFTSTVQTFSKIPLLIACDEEGGRVARLKSSIGAHNVKAMFGYKDDGADTAFANAVILAQALKERGFNMDFAPVADVWSNPANSVIGDRAYSDDYQQTVELVKAAQSGFKSENIISVLKHFPGHGNTLEDSHYGMAYIRKTREQLLSEDLLPFKDCINAGAEVVMLGHLVVEDLDTKPATLSKVIVTDLLREELGFDGVVVTDALNMQAMTKYLDGGEIAVKAISAGVDMLLAPDNLSNAITAIQNAVADSTLTEEQINESVARIVALKLKHFSIP